MKTSVILAGLAATIIGLVAMVAIVAAVNYFQAASYGNAAEQQLLAKYEDNKNVLGQYTLKIGEMAQVPEIARDDLQAILQTTFEGRYGTEGVERGAGDQRMFQWLQEHNPTITTELYVKLQQTMEAGRNEFQVSQTTMLDMKRAYTTALGSPWDGFWLKLAGYPKINLDDIKIVVAADTQQKFETGVDGGIQLRKRESSQ